MKFLEKITEEIDPGAKSSALTSFSYFIECEKINIHYVRIQKFNQSAYNKALTFLIALELYYKHFD